MFDFNGKVAVITGGAQGIGKCIAEQFKTRKRNGCRVGKNSIFIDILLW